MPAWPGGPCPKCGEEMPENLIHCQKCRALLNEELDRSSAEIPEFIPLQEIATMVEVEAAGYLVECPNCERELRINKKYKSETVACKFCTGQFVLDVGGSAIRTVAFYTNCPHCSEELRIANKYMGMNVACKLCGGKIHFVDGS